MHVSTSEHSLTSLVAVPAWLPSGTTLAPLPSTRRGYGIVLNASPKDQKIIYTNGRLVIVRSLAPGGCEGSDGEAVSAQSQ